MSIALPSASSDFKLSLYIAACNEFSKSARYSDNPKSVNFAFHFSSSNTLLGFTSLCTTSCCSFKYRSAAVVCAHTLYVAPKFGTHLFLCIAWCTDPFSHQGNTSAYSGGHARAPTIWHTFACFSEDTIRSSAWYLSMSVFVRSFGSFIATGFPSILERYTSDWSDWNIFIAVFDDGFFASTNRSRAIWKLIFPPAIGVTQQPRKQEEEEEEEACFSEGDDSSFVVVPLPLPKSFSIVISKRRNQKSKIGDENVVSEHNEYAECFSLRVDVRRPKTKALSHTRTRRTSFAVVVFSRNRTTRKKKKKKKKSLCERKI